MLRAALLALALAPAAAECPNACSGHGTCGAFDECQCFPNWQEADCSGRTCPFALAHVDTPKGDLDGSADALSGPGTTVIVDSTVYPSGTTEQYPAMVDSEGASLINTAHAYAECGNKGICDRGSGECECFPGYAGAGCQKAACADPTCSGHGTCMSAEQLAAADYGNVYLLWDKEVSMGCKCEPGYSGPNCANKMCKYGIDPLYIDDDMMTVRTATARVILSFDNSTIDAGDATYQPYASGDETLSMAGTYAIKFYDAFGEDYETEALSVDASCDEITAALEGMANSVIPAGGVSCKEYPRGATLTSVMYDLTFEENPGDLKPIEIDTYLDGARPTVYVSDGNDIVDFDVDVEVYPNFNGVSGEFVDYFPTYCPGVTIGVAESGSKAEKKAGGFSYATGLTSDEEKALKACLGDADGNPDNNVEVYNWDKGLVNETSNPHLVKLAPHPTSGANPKVDAYDAGKYYLLYFGAYDGDFDATDGGSKFYFSGLPDVDRDYIVFPTEGTATVLGNDTDSSASRAPITAYFGKGTTTVYTSMDVSCDSGVTPLNACLNKGDKVFLFNNQPDGHENTALTTYSEGLVKDSSSTGNMYEVVKVGKKGMSSVTPYVEDRFYFVVDKVINWDGSALAPRSSFEDGTLSAAALGYTELGNLAYPQSQKVGLQSVVKFDVSNAASYEFVSQCSGRGLCNGDSGLCECFAGYTNDNCDLQSALAS